MSVFRPTSIDFSDLLERVIWTGAQAFLSVVSVEAIFDTGTNVVTAGLIAAGAGAISIVKNVIFQRLSELEDGA